MQSFFLGAGLGTAGLGAMVADPITIVLSIAAICIAGLMPDTV